MYKKEELQNLIFNHLREKKFRSSNSWVFQQYNLFRCELAKPIEYGEFIEIMIELCNDAIFEITEQNKNTPPIFALTSKGEKMLWSD